MRKLIASMATVGVMAFAVPAFAELTTQEQADIYKTQMDARKAYREANGIQPNVGMGLGRGRGSGAGIGKGAGMGMRAGINQGAGCYYQVPAEPIQ